MLPLNQVSENLWTVLLFSPLNYLLISTAYYRKLLKLESEGQRIISPTGKFNPPASPEALEKLRHDVLHAHAHH